MRTIELLVIKFGDISPEAFYDFKGSAYGFDIEPDDGYSWFAIENSY